MLFLFILRDKYIPLYERNLNRVKTERSLITMKIILRTLLEVIFYGVTMPIKVVVMLWLTARAAYYGIKYGKDWWCTYWKDFWTVLCIVLKVENIWIRHGKQVADDYMEEVGL